MPRRTELSPTELLVMLALARLGEEAYGVTIQQEIVDRTGREVSTTAVYGALERIERRGYAEPWMSEPLPERGGRSRRHYRLLPKGRAALAAERDIFDRMWSGLEIAGQEIRS